MNIYNWLVVKITNKHLAKSREKLKENLAQDSVFQKVYNTYEKDLDMIFKKTTYWHGTGFYQYKTLGDSKYQKVSKTKIFNVLESIIAEKGLRPHQDPWIKTQRQYSKSVSTTKFRIYGRLYSELHMNPKNKLEITYGDRLYFAKFFIHYTFANSPLKIIFGFIVSSFMKKFATKGQLWARTINSNITSKGNAMSDFINIVGNQKSNIPNNFGILIGINNKGVEPVEMNKYIALLETRSRIMVNMNNFTHIEVPLKNINQTMKFLNKYNVKLPIIPIEIAEVYFSKYNIQDLIK